MVKFTDNIKSTQGNRLKIESLGSDANVLSSDNIGAFSKLFKNIVAGAIKGASLVSDESSRETYTNYLNNLKTTYEDRAIFDYEKVFVSRNSLNTMLKKAKTESGITQNSPEELKEKVSKIEADIKGSFEYRMKKQVEALKKQFS